MEPLWRLGLMLVVTDYPRCLFGVRLADGEVLWRSQEGNVQPPLALYGKGAFVLVTDGRNPEKRFGLVWVSAQDGRGQFIGALDATKLQTLGGQRMGGDADIQVLGNTLFVINDLGVVREYACADLIKNARNSSVTSPHNSKGLSRIELFHSASVQ